MEHNKKEVIIEVPHRISGFFEIVDEKNGKKIYNPEEIGSRGAGFNLNAIGRTKVIIEKTNDSSNHDLNIFINDEKLNERAETTYFIYNYVKEILKKSFKVNIIHNFDLPVGCGYGASGSGALGAIYGLNKLFNLGLSLIERGKIAHIAEVVNQTGLGTVCGQLCGGLCILKEPGYPCVFESISFPKNLEIICGTFGMIHTKSILTDPLLNKEIKEAGRRALNKLNKNKNIKTFIKCSIQFVKDTNILNILNLSEIQELLESLNKLDILGASMNQLGRSVYAICQKSEINEVIDIFNSYKPEIQIFNLKISAKGPTIL